MLDRRTLLQAAPVAVVVAAAPGAANPPPVLSRHADAPLFDAFARWAALNWRMEVEVKGMTDEEAYALLDQTNVAARAVFEAPAATTEGFALQVYIQLYSVYGGTKDDPIMPDWPRPEENCREADMLRPLYRRVMEMTAAIRAPWVAAT